MSFAISPVATTLDLTLFSTGDKDKQEQGCQLVLDKILSGQMLSAQEIMGCVESLPLAHLVKLTAQVTSLCAKPRFHTCAITNVKSGRCSEDCKWCAQSQHYATAVAEYDVKAPDTCRSEAHTAHAAKVEMFSFVASGRRPNGSGFKKLLAAVDDVKAHEPIELCASLGLATPDMLKQLKEHGLKRYHCNLESSERFFPQLCTTHTYEQKINTLLAAREAGLELCSGGIIGMGETMQDRLDLALTLRELQVPSVPVNVLHPIAGTPLQDQPPLSGEEIVRSVALFRLTLPSADLRFAGGRDLMSKQLQQQCIAAGINAAIVGTLLTTSNQEAIQQDVVELHQSKQAVLNLTMPQAAAKSQAAGDAVANAAAGTPAPAPQALLNGDNQQATIKAPVSELSLLDCLTPVPEDVVRQQLKFKQL